jgi:hypothetical protein
MTKKQVRTRKPRPKRVLLPGDPKLGGFKSWIWDAGQQLGPTHKLNPTIAAVEEFNREQAPGGFPGIPNPPNTPEAFIEFLHVAEVRVFIGDEQSILVGTVKEASAKAMLLVSPVPVVNLPMPPTPPGSPLSSDAVTRYLLALRQWALQSHADAANGKPLSGTTKYTVIRLCNLAGVGNATLHKYAKLANVPTPETGKRNHQFTTPEARAILQCIIDNSSAGKTVAKCRAALVNSLK